MRNALISVSDKTGVVEFATGLKGLGFNIISTGGTLKTLEDAGIRCQSISDVTGFPECLDGRVKTLHPNVHAGLLALRNKDSHVQTLKELNISFIDVVAVNLYPFKQTVSRPGVRFEDAVENIDIGGPSMLRSAAKNYQSVYAVCDGRDYNAVLDAICLESQGQTEDAQKLRLNLMFKVYSHTAYYDSMIAAYLSAHSPNEYPDVVTMGYEKVQDLRYGENPHQTAAFYKEPVTCGTSIADAVQLHGKELSFNNINDTNAALMLLKEFDSSPCVVAVKHTNPCGVGLGDSIYQAYMRAYESDTVSVFGGIIAANRIIDARTAQEISKIFLEIVIAEDFEPEALSILTQKKNLRLLKLKGIAAPICPGTLDYKKTAGGMLIQGCDTKLYNSEDFVVVTKAKPTPAQLRQMEFAYKVVKHTRSNAIVLVNGDSTCGIGVGQTNRIWPTEQAIARAGQRAVGSVMASDAFFPFPDCAEAAAKAGIAAIIQPGGALRDNQTIEVCDKYGIAMAICGMRHFKH